MAARRGKGKSGGACEPRRGAGCPGLDPSDLALPDEEIRRLVLRITTADGVEPFVRRMVRCIDRLKVARPVKPPPRGASHDLLALVSAISRASDEGRFMHAYFTAFLAAHYAYQNSLEYACALYAYLERFRGK